MSFDTLLFRCAICRRDIRDWPGRNGRDAHLEPICRSCESVWTSGTGRPQHGSFKDRRRAMQLLALAEALHNRAALINWEDRVHGRA